MSFFSEVWKGYLKISIRGVQVDRFINLCKHRRICLNNICFVGDNDVTCDVGVKDFYLLQTIRRKTFVKIRIIKKHGLPFFFLHHKKRKAFFLGLVISLLVVWMLSTRMWSIHIEGNVRNTTPEIMKFLQDAGICHGMKTEKIDCKSIVKLLRERYEDITWASAKLHGSTLILNIKEGVLLEEVYESENPSNIIADKSGMIVEMVTRAGVPTKKQGDICEKGEILVNGQIEILNDSKEIIRYDYVHADADVYIQYKIPYYKEIPMEYEIYEETGKIKKGFGIQINGLYCEAGGGEKMWCQEREIKRIQITESLYLPIEISKLEAREYKKERKIRTNKEAEYLALQELHKYEENLLQKGVQIFANNVTIKFSQKICISSGYLEIIEKIGIDDPILIQEQPIRKDIEE